MSRSLQFLALAAFALAKTNSSLRACGKDCPGDDDGGMDLIKTEIPEKPSSDLGDTFDNLEAWNEYVDKVANPNPMAAASERAAMFVNKLKRKHDQQQRELASSNEELRLSTKGGLMTILSKFATRWEQEQRNQVMIAMFRVPVKLYPILLLDCAAFFRAYARALPNNIHGVHPCIRP